MKPNDFGGSVSELVLRAKGGDELAQAHLPRELERQLGPMVRRCLRSGRNASPLERRIMREFRSLTGDGFESADVDHERMVAIIAERMAVTIARRLLKGNLAGDTVVT